MSKYTKAREIIEKEIQDNTKTADKYFNYCKDMSDNVARKYNYLLQAESLISTNRMLQSLLRHVDFLNRKNTNDDEQYMVLLNTLFETSTKAKIYANSIYGKNIEDHDYQRSIFIFHYTMSYQLGKIYSKLFEISEDH